MRTRHVSWLVALFALGLLVSCEDGEGQACLLDSDCADFGQVCLEGRCRAPGDVGDAGARDAGNPPDAGRDAGTSRDAGTMDAGRMDAGADAGSDAAVDGSVDGSMPDGSVDGSVDGAVDGAVDGGVDSGAAAP
ncbi:MAG: hypothetical protein AB8I08_18870 [Sandaracinaceae bacterium]